MPFLFTISVVCVIAAIAAPILLRLFAPILVRRAKTPKPAPPSKYDDGGPGHGEAKYANGGGNGDRDLRLRMGRGGNRRHEIEQVGGAGAFAIPDESATE